MIDILLYLFDQKLADDAAYAGSQVQIQQQLIAQGFAPYEINLALNWLKDLKEWCEVSHFRVMPQATSVRVWTSEELKKLTRATLEMLCRLEQQEVIDQWQREIIIDRAMAINTNSIDVEQIKWVTLIVLYYARLETKPMAWIEHVLLQEPSCQH
jgi:Smg protein